MITHRTTTSISPQSFNSAYSQLSDGTPNALTWLQVATSSLPPRVVTSTQPATTSNRFVMQLPRCNFADLMVFGKNSSGNVQNGVGLRVIGWSPLVRPGIVTLWFPTLLWFGSVGFGSVTSSPINTAMGNLYAANYFQPYSGVPVGAITATDSSGHYPAHLTIDTLGSTLFEVGMWGSSVVGTFNPIVQPI